MNSHCVKPLLTFKKHHKGIIGTATYHGITVHKLYRSRRYVRRALLKHVRVFDTIYEYASLFPSIIAEAHPLEEHDTNVRVYKSAYLDAVRDKADIPVLTHLLKQMTNDEEGLRTAYHASYTSPRQCGKHSMMSIMFKSVTLLNFMLNPY